MIAQGLNALIVSQNMRLALSKLSYSGKVFIHAYGDSNKILDDLITSGDSPLLFLLLYFIDKTGMCYAFFLLFYNL